MSQKASSSDLRSVLTSHVAHAQRKSSNASDLMPSVSFRPNLPLSPSQSLSRKRRKVQPAEAATLRSDNGYPSPGASESQRSTTQPVATLRSSSMLAPHLQPATSDAISGIAATDALSAPTVEVRTPTRPSTLLVPASEPPRCDPCPLPCLPIRNVESSKTIPRAPLQQASSASRVPLAKVALRSETALSARISPRLTSPPTSARNVEIKTLASASAATPAKPISLKKLPGAKLVGGRSLDIFRCVVLMHSCERGPQRRGSFPSRMTRMTFNLLRLLFYLILCHFFLAVWGACLILCMLLSRLQGESCSLHTTVTLAIHCYC